MVIDRALARQHPGMRPGPHVTLAISDTGEGMGAATPSRILEPFFTTKRRRHGNGPRPGRRVSHRQAEWRLHRGRERPRPRRPIHGLPTRGVAGGRGPWTRCLTRLGWRRCPGGRPPSSPLVEDEEAVRDLIREILQHAGYTVLGARHGGEALVVADGHPGTIHLLGTDVVMPGLGGRPRADRLVAARPAIKVIFLSGYTGEAIERHGALRPGRSSSGNP